MSRFNGKWCVSNDGTSFGCTFDIKEEAIEEGKLLEYKAIYVAKCVDDFAPSISVEDIIEDIQNEAYNCGGEYAEDYLDDVTDKHKRELEEELNNVLSNWINKYNYQHNFYSVIDVEKVDIS